MRYSFVVLDKTWNDRVTLNSISRLSNRYSMLYKKERYKRIISSENCDLAQNNNNGIKMGFTELHPMFNLSLIDSITNTTASIIADFKFEDIIYSLNPAFVELACTILPTDWVAALKFKN
jgi:hypothetical protein